MNFFEDIRVGQKNALGSYTFTAEEIVAFAREFDPQPFHIDADAATRSHFGALCASGWHTACVWMKMNADQHGREEADQRARGEPSPHRGPSPGFRDLKWPNAVYVNDTITYASEVIEKRPVRSRSEWGLAFSHCTGRNQSGALVLSFVSALFIQRRSPALNEPQA